MGKRQAGRVREPIGTAGLLLALLALIAACAGGAFAAVRLTAPERKEVVRIARRQAGPPGVSGAQGPSGTPGRDGATAISPTATEFTGSRDGHCLDGGVEIAGAGPAAYLCDGVPGATGFTEFLPPGKTETGVWSIQEPRIIGIGERRTQVSFPIPVALKGVESGSAFFIDASEVAAGSGPQISASGCTGTGRLPTAPVGELCVYAHSEAEEKVSPSTLITDYDRPSRPATTAPPARS